MKKILLSLILCLLILTVSSCDDAASTLVKMDEGNTTIDAVSKEIETEVDPAPDTTAIESEEEIITEVESGSETTAIESEEESQPLKLVISDFENIEEHYAINMRAGTESTPREGNGYIESIADDAVVILKKMDPIDISDFVENGKLHISLYVSDPSNVAGGQIELTSSDTADKDEIRWGEFINNIPLEAGWNDIILSFSDGIITGEPNFKEINYFRVYLNLENRTTILGADDLYLYTESKSSKHEYKTVIESFDMLDSKWRMVGNLSVEGASKSASETPFYRLESNGDAVLVKEFNPDFIDLSLYEEQGYLHLWLYVEDPSKIFGGQIELTSSAISDSDELHFGEMNVAYPLSAGWNELNLPFSELKPQNGVADLSKINYIRIYVNAKEKVNIGFDDLYAYIDTDEIPKNITFENENKSIIRKKLSGSNIDLARITKELQEDGKHIVGWTDGTDTYPINGVYTVGEDDATLSAVLEYWEQYNVVYFDGSSSSIQGKSSYENGVIKLEASPFEKEGYTFAGWKDNNGNTYKAGHSYVINANDNNLTAIWEAIDDYKLLADAQEAWELREGGPTDIAPSAIAKTDAELKWTVWLNSETFGQVLDFSTEGSVLKAKDTKVDLTGDFAISAWIKAPVREEGVRTIATGGSVWAVILDENGELSFEANGVEGLESSDVALIDGCWHHVLVSRGGDTLTYYVDGESVKTLTVSGVIGNTKHVYIGSASSGKKGFDGSIAQVRIYGADKNPAEVTSVKIIESDNVRRPASFDYHQGITILRGQGYGTKMTSDVKAADVKACKDMGFKFIRMLATVDNLVGDGGKLNREYIDYLSDVVDTITENDMPCMISLGCLDRARWNGKYLGSSEEFEELVVFFGELAEWIKKNGWSNDEVSLLLFTEPDNYSDMDWTWMSDRLCAAIRNVLPDMTIITSSDRTADLVAILDMSPVTDDNVVYSFTSYDPSTVAFNSLHGLNNVNFWDYIGEVPYPILEGVDYTQAIEESIANVPENMKEEARRVISGYVQGKYDASVKNYFEGTLYNADWLMLRAKTLDDWSNKYGGDIHMFVAEFGGCDKYSNIALGAAEGSGISEKTRLSLIKDSRISYDTYGIGWALWGYSEDFTVFDPSLPRWINITEAMYSKYMYKDMLEALGLEYNKDLIK